MKNKIVLIFFLILFSEGIIFSQQKLEIFGGAGFNHFYDFPGNRGHFNSSYQPGNYFLGGIGFEFVEIDWTKMKFTISFEKYTGEIIAREGMLGSGYSVDAKTKKSLVSLSVFPVYLKLLNNFDLNIGATFSVLADENFSGTFDTWSASSSGTSVDINEKYQTYNSKFLFGLKFRIAYNINLNERFTIVP